VFKQMLQSQDQQTNVESYQGAESQAQQSQIDAQNTHSKSDLVQEMSQHTSDDKQDNFLKYEKIKNVFKLLIENAEYLIDDRAFERCAEASMKEQFSIKIDSIRKSLGVEEMRDVDLLVQIFYEFEDKYLAEDQRKWEEELKQMEETAQEAGMPLPAQEMRRKSQEEIDEERAERERNPARLNIDPDNIVLAL
jgi:hypothetical protein